MLTISAGRITTKPQEPIALANSAGAHSYCFGLPNSLEAITDDRGWTVIPFGMWRHAAGWQRFGQLEAESIVNAFKSTWGRFKRAIVGLPIFKGHPDNPDLANQYPDRTIYGNVADMEVRDEGLAIKQVLTEAGGRLVANGKDRISPNWYVEETGEKKNEMPVFVPIAIKSIGLVDKPNIPNLSLANALTNDPMKDLLLKALKALFPTLSNESTDAEILEAVTSLTKRPEPTALANVQDQLAAKTKELEIVTADRDAQKARADAGAIALANAKTAEIKEVLDGAIKDGRITAADRKTWETVLANDLDAGKRILANVKAKVKTSPRVASETAAELDRKAREEFANGGKPVANSGDAPEEDGMSNGDKINKLVNAEMKALGYHPNMTANEKNTCRNRAWSNVKKMRPELFGPEHGTNDESRDEDKKEDGK